MIGRNRSLYWTDIEQPKPGPPINGIKVFLKLNKPNSSWLMELQTFLKLRPYLFKVSINKERKIKRKKKVCKNQHRYSHWVCSLSEDRHILALCSLHPPDPPLTPAEVSHGSAELQGSVTAPNCSGKLNSQLVQDVFHQRMIFLKYFYLLAGSNTSCINNWQTWNFRTPAARWFLLSNSTLTKFL